MRLFDEQNGAACCIKDSEVISFNLVVVMVQGFLLDGGGCGLRCMVLACIGLRTIIVGTTYHTIPYLSNWL